MMQVAAAARPRRPHPKRQRARRGCRRRLLRRRALRQRRHRNAAASTAKSHSRHVPTFFTAAVANIVVVHASGADASVVFNLVHALHIDVIQHVLDIVVVMDLNRLATGIRRRLGDLCK